MSGETNLFKIVKGMTPTLNPGEYVFSSVDDLTIIDRNDTICQFKEKEGFTVILSKKRADELNLKYELVASWITLMINSSLNTVGFTAVFSTELAKHNISCNVIAGYYHDHIFVDTKNAERAIDALQKLSDNYS